MEENYFLAKPLQVFWYVCKIWSGIHSNTLCKLLHRNLSHAVRSQRDLVLALCYVFPSWSIDFRGWLFHLRLQTPYSYWQLKITHVYSHVNNCITMFLPKAGLTNCLCSLFYFDHFYNVHICRTVYRENQHIILGKSNFSHIHIILISRHALFRNVQKYEH